MSSSLLSEDQLKVETDTSDATRAYAEASDPQATPEVFSLQRWTPPLGSLMRQYQDASPVPHIFLENFLDASIASLAAAQFPEPNTAEWTHYQHHNENKHGMTRRLLFPSSIGAVSDALNAPDFLRWLSALTGISNLIADPSLEGGGLHQSRRGGFLNVHTDFSHHHYHPNWKRRVNLIVYLNEGWEAGWGGALELWDSGMRECIAKYPPRLNCAVIFNTDEHSFHGFPDPLECPVETSRKSLAFYYYTLDKAADLSAKATSRSTNYRARPGDGWATATMIWLDKQAVNLYSRAKARFGFSDRMASRLLDRFSRRRSSR